MADESVVITAEEDYTSSGRSSRGTMTGIPTRLLTSLMFLTKFLITLALIGCLVAILTLQKIERNSVNHVMKRFDTVTDSPEWLDTPHPMHRRLTPSEKYTNPSSLHVCINIHGGLGNQLWMYALVHFVRANYGHVVHADVDLLTPFFNITPPADKNVSDKLCPTVLKAKYDVGYDSMLLSNVSTMSVNLDGYFQSYKYWNEMVDSIRKEFTFLPHITAVAKRMLLEVAMNSKFRGQPVTYVGVHVRRGDFLKDTHSFNFGYVVATDDYLQKALSYYEQKYQNVMFVVISNDIPWTKNAFIGRDNIAFIQGSKREIDMAVLTLCDHTVMTVGTFGWWTAFLTGGEVVYFKTTRRPYSGLDNVTSPDDTEFFFPGWVGMT